MADVDIDGNAVPLAVIVIVAILVYLLALLIIITVHAHFRRKGLLRQVDSTEDQTGGCCDGCCRSLAECCPCGLPSLHAMLKTCCPRRRPTFMSLITCECLRPTVHGAQGGAGINLVCCEIK
uniref:Uncharacterized protein n=1 Tax=Plectus sambesii TaxID=2011161 RepID=A0A914V128_9BILA